MEKTMISPRNDSQHLELVDELYKRYWGGNYGEKKFLRRYYFLRKKYAWILIIGGAKALKRLIDIFASGLLLLGLSPLFFVVAVAIKLTDHGPVLFWQTRVGRWGKEFPFPKFRSMVVNAEEIKKKIMAQSHHKNSVTFKMKSDPRLTTIGRIIRKFSIDELPQLWNILRGEMSLVGPRPPLPQEVAQYSLADRKRLNVIPGLTCIWQVEGRGDIPFDQQVKLDIQYIESQSFFLDIKLLLKTVPAVLLGKGAY